MTEAMDYHGVTWYRSNACADSSCAEVAMSCDEVLVRNSQRPNEVTRFTIEEWKALTAGIRAGDFPF